MDLDALVLLYAGFDAPRRLLHLVVTCHHHPMWKDFVWQEAVPRVSSFPFVVVVLFWEKIGVTRTFVPLWVWARVPFHRDAIRTCEVLSMSPRAIHPYV